jgi:hypothetical protein
LTEPLTPLDIAPPAVVSASVPAAAIQASKVAATPSPAA